MYSNKQRFSAFVTGFFAAFFLTWAFIAFEINYGSMRLISRVIPAETTMHEEPSAETTTYEATSAETEEIINDHQAAEVSSHAAGTEVTVTEAALRESSAAEKPDGAQPTLPPEEGTSFIEEEPDDFDYLTTGMTALPDFAAPALLLVSLGFLLVFLLRLKKDRPLAGPDGALLIAAPALSLLISGILPDTFYGRGVPEMNLFLRTAINIEGYVPRFLCFLTLIFALREIVRFFFSRFDRRCLLTVRLASGKDPAAKPTALPVLLPVFVIIISILSAAFSLLVLLDNRYGREALICLIIAACSLLLLIFAFLALFSGISEMRRVRDEAVEEAVKNERLRIDLIANVSHDLRTPLTSIIGYGSLLEKEELSENARENLRLLNQKSGYMKDLVESIFELTKVSSGVLQCTKTQIDLVRLLEQSAGLFEDDMKEAGLTLKRHYCSESLMIETDGAFLSRVIANLFQNAVKYGLAGTRIHLTLTKEPGFVRIRMQNVASYEMNFDPGEITERFTRGDESRTTKGSGLGLAIAKTYTEAVGGAFHVEIDGDVFSAVITLPLA